MTSVRLAHFSDLHFGARTLAEADRCFGAAIDQAATESASSGSDALGKTARVTRLSSSGRATPSMA